MLVFPWSLQNSNFMISFVLATPFKPCLVYFQFFLQSKLKVNKGKDFTRDNIEIIITGPPGGFALVEGAELTLWKHGAKTFLTQEMVLFENSK